MALSDALRHRIASHPRIRCTGFVNDTAPYYRAMDMLVLPTWREGFSQRSTGGRVQWDPVITTLSTGSRDAVLPESPAAHPAWLPASHFRSGAEADSQSALRRRMGEAGRAWVLEHFVDRRVLGLAAAYYRACWSPRLPRRSFDPLTHGPRISGRADLRRRLQRMGSVLGCAQHSPARCPAPA